MPEADSMYTLESLDTLEREARAQLAAVASTEDAEEFRIRYLGKKGAVRNAFKSLKDVPEAQRKDFGARINAIRAFLEEQFEAAPWQASGPAISGPLFDYSLPGFPFPRGSLHILNEVRNEIRDIFAGIGFDVADGPEVETDWYNFEALNTPPHHPARDMQDTFYVAEDIVLRTHTSPVQIRVMQTQKPPIRCIMPGRVYRNEEISARSYCLFHQIEGLYVDEDVSFADLKSTLLSFSRRFFGPDAQIKIRPSFFPFTEPSVEIDVRCFLCKGNGCSICKHSGWLEILGAGMVHPNVFDASGVDSERYTGFAFGIGIERITLLKHGIDDIRLFFENDMRFLAQF